MATKKTIKKSLPRVQLLLIFVASAVLGFFIWRTNHSTPRSIPSTVVDTSSIELSTVVNNVRYTNNIAGFSLEFPRAYYYEASAKSLSLRSFSNESIDPRYAEAPIDKDNIIIELYVHEMKGKTLDDAYNELVSLGSKAGDKIITKNNIQIGGKEGYQYTIKSGFGGQLSEEYLFINRGYMIYFGRSPLDTSREDEFQTILNSITIGK